MSSRAAHQCHRDGCDSEATTGIKVHINCVLPGQVFPLHMDSTIRVCTRHADVPEIRRFIFNDQNRESITAKCLDEGLGEPDFLTARIELVPLTPAMILAAPPTMCDRDGCAKPAAWQVVQTFRMMWQKAGDAPMIEVLTNLCVCDEHRPEVKREHFLDQESRSQTLGWLAAKGVSMPDLDTMEITFRAVNGPRLEPKAFVGDNGPLDQFKK